ncbi:LysR family transcriptional regulator [Chelatococcus sp. GCM10030263]|uniref:LysR family transcriptional regulator n=1 Tax=Chelatococcus sp. GCM10030263 TaxID=3273387 RepID=UPI00360A54B2
MFLAVYSLRNLTKAAEREHIAPSAISKRLQDLELELGVSLFYRHTRGVTPTPAGEVLAGHVYRLFDDVNRMSLELSDYASGVRGQVRIHAHTSAVVEYLPDDIASFVEAYPNVRVALREETSPNVLQSTLDGVADIGVFAGNLAVPTGLQVRSYKQDRLVALFPAGHRMADLDTVTFSDICDNDHISLESGSSLQVLLAQAAESMGFMLNTRIEVTTFEAAMRMVDVGLGVAVIPEGVVRVYAGKLRVRAVPLDDEWARRNLLICVKDEEKLTASARVMLQHLLGDPMPRSCQKTKPLLPNR